jgi:ankyrin repeat protein
VLIANGGDVGSRDFMNRTLLWQAAARSAALTETLISCNSKIDVNDLSSGEYGTALMAAAVAGQVENVRLLIAAGADVNLAALSTQETPLIAVAKRHGRTSIARVLIDAGAKLDCVDASAATALHWAANRGFAPLVRLLLLRGADTGPLNARQETALAVAQRFRHHDIVNWLTVHPQKQMRELLIFLCFALQPLDLPVLLTLTIFDHFGYHLAEFAPPLHKQWEMAKRIKHYVKQKQ